MADPDPAKPPTTDQPTLAVEHPAGVATALPCFPDYVLECEIGRGGMGVVYKAFEPALGRHVALKMVLSGTSSNAEELQRFQREASATARLSHPNIVRVHRVGVQDSCPFFSMDYVNGPSLTQRVASGPLPGRVAARYLVTIARAIHHAHQQGILHRDLKPSNILIDDHDQPKVADFGLAKQLGSDSSQTRTGSLVGTPSYMAPEQAAGQRDLTPATDVYGLGTILYELLTARPPFRGETALDTVSQVLQNDPAPPRLLNPRIDRDLETICLKCLNKAPRHRYPSAKALADDLMRYLDGESIQARSFNLLDRVGRALERSHFDFEFRAYGNLLLWFALIVGGMHVLKHLALVQRQPPLVSVLLQVIQFILMILALLRYRRKGLLPTSTAERQLWAVWISYVLASALLTVQVQVLFTPEAMYQGVQYPFFAVLTGVAFFVLGSSYWGKLYVVAVAFFVLSMLLLMRLEAGTLAFGGLWTLTLTWLGIHLRRLGRERPADEETNQPPP